MKDGKLKLTTARLLGCAVLLALGVSLAARGGLRVLSPQDRVAVFEKIWKEVDEHYYDPEFGGVNWKGIREKYLPLVQSVKDDKDFYALMDHLTGELHDAHTRFSSPEQWENRKKHQGLGFGFHAGFVEGKVVVLDVIPGSNAAKGGIAPGLAITALDGKPMESELTDAAGKVLRSSSERITQLRILSAIFAGTGDAPAKLSLERMDGTHLEVTISRQVLSTEPHVTSMTLPSGFGYIRFDEFHPSVVHPFKSALESFRDTRGLVLDLRRNRGGDGATLGAVAGFFFDKKTVFERRMSRRQVSASERDGRHTEETVVRVGRGGEQVYAGPLVILLSEFSASATEVFAAGMQDSARATLVGSQTCGCVLGITHDRVMKGGGVLEISEILWFSPKGRKLEGEGVIPDKIVVPRIASLSENRDVVLEEGEKTLRELAAAAKAAPAH
jgi:carboxyl-terminal processing protease